jgi:hypothetical protein
MVTAAATPSLIEQGRSWLADLDWADRDHIDFTVLSDAEVQYAIDRHYDGGWAGFVADGTVQP